jgi:hypothetical protein
MSMTDRTRTSEEAQVRNVGGVAIGSRVDRRNAILQAALRTHDESQCRCGRKYVMSCPRLAQFILEQGDTVI